VFAEIAVDTYQDPTKRLFTYKVPEELVEKVEEGTRVLVPFGKRSVEGYIFELKRVRPSFPTREIKAVKGPTLTPSQVKLARWMSEYYSAPPLDCLKCQLPGKGERYTEGKDNKIKTLLLVPYAAQVKLRALELFQAERKITLVGSRSAVFASLPNLEKIIIEEPENWAYKDERSPYYHAKDVAQKRAELEGLKLELRHLIPRVEDLPLRKLRKEPLAISHEPLAAKVKIIDLKKEREAGNLPAGRHGFSPLSSAAAEAFKQSKQGLAYAHSREVKEEVEKAIRAKGWDANRIEIAGAEIFTQVGKAYDTVVMIDADTLLNLPDFRAHEKLLLTVAKLSRLTLQRRASKQIFVQTANAEYPLWAELKNSNLKDFYQRELAARKPFFYPPFGVLAKLEFSAKTTAKVNFEAEKLYEKLSTINYQLSTIKVTPPYPPYSKSRGKAQLNIAVKSKSRKDLEKALDLVPPTWKIIVDPESLL
jgi:primosomal protein N'